jgi:PAT family beta-lactamase induction signal transducer AmpG
MIVCGIAQSVANFMYIWLHYQPVVSSSLFVTIVCDNVTGGMGAVALISYLSMLCNKKYTATQYALLSSLASLASTTLVIKSGSLVKSLGWDAFFTLTVFLEIPALLFLIYIGNRFGFNKQLGKI